MKAPHWDTSRTVELWWTDKSRRINQSAGDSHVSKSGNQAAASEDGDFTWDVSDWEMWLEPHLEDDDVSSTDDFEIDIYLCMTLYTCFLTLIVTMCMCLVIHCGCQANSDMERHSVLAL